MSAIRMVDTFTIAMVRVGGPGQPNLDEAVKEIGGGQRPTNISVRNDMQVLDLTALLTLKSGDVTGTHEVTLVTRQPDGREIPFPQTFPVTLNGGVHGVSVIVRFMMPQSSPEGLYWFDVFWNKEPLTSIPLKLVRRPESEAPAQS